MAFKAPVEDEVVPETPDRLFLQLTRRKIPDVLPHQQEVMREYARSAADKSDVALQLPTGSGKTLVGLLIGEWRRRKMNERTVYLCPTNQLVYQTVEQAQSKYGIDAIAFTGSKKDYAAADKARYRGRDVIAVTTYSSLFNVAPYFNDPELVIIDDAHASENYIASMWSLRVDPQDPDHKPLQAAIAGVLRPHIPKLSYSRMVGAWRDSTDATWVDKIPTPLLYSLKDELSAVFAEYTDGTKLGYQWSTLQDHLSACHLYISSREILLRPIIPPTWSHPPFVGANQRLFMSATLGAGGDLERLTGRQAIHRVSVPKGWENQGVGRRFFMFPGLSLDGSDTHKLRNELMRKAGRSLILTPSGPVAEKTKESVTKELRYAVFGAEDIEQSKAPFVSCEAAVAVMANRYDGVDFPGNECRFLSVDGLPRATNAQEKFLMARMGSTVLFNERIQTRVLQAIGRCTRSLEDYSAVFVTGQEIEDYLTDDKRLQYLHPELQAEVSFGVRQSTGQKHEDFVENFEVFVDNGRDWEGVNRQIVAERSKLKQQPFPAMADLEKAVSCEIRYQEAMWQEDYASAMAHAESVLGHLGSAELRGYRALWHYLAGSAAWLSGETGNAVMKDKAVDHFAAAKKAANAIPWLVALSTYAKATSDEDGDDDELMAQIENLEVLLERLGILHDRSYTRFERGILEALETGKDFEAAHVKLGEALGFSAGKIESDASPDPWWLSARKCFVFEDHADAKESSVLGAEKARQAADHPRWMEDNVEDAKGLEMIPVLVTPVSRAGEGAFPHLKVVAHWGLADFVEWARSALAVVRELRKTFREAGDLDWRASAAAAFEANKMSAPSLARWLKSRPAADHLKQ